MKNVNDFVRNDWGLMFDETLDEQIENYEEINSRIDECLSKKEEYDKLISEDTKSDKLSFKERWNIYRIVNNLIKKYDDNHYLNIDLQELRSSLERAYVDVNNCAKNDNLLRSLKEEKYRILTEYITFDAFRKYYFNKCCMKRHYFVRLDGELRCMSCGVTTRDYPLSKKQLDFLTLCADKKDCLLKYATKGDFPLIKVIMERQDFYRSLREPLDLFEDDHEKYMEEFEAREVEDDINWLRLNEQIKVAHMLDSKIYTEDIKYLSDERAKELLLEVEKEYNRVKNIDSRFKDLMIEECLTAKYEILLLSGKHIPTLFKELKNENEEIAFIKAYYNISNERFRDNSEYFGETDSFESLKFANSYMCVTASKKINNRVLKMKVRR